MSAQLYPVSTTYLSCDDYEITVDGVGAMPDTARVSAYPFNRRWPGYQRSLDQTELVNFLSLAVEGTVTYTIRPKKPFDPAALKIRPQSLGIAPTVKDGVITFTLDRPAYFTVEPYGRNHALHVFADPMPRYDVDIHADNVIYFGAGEHDAGLIELTSGQTLYLDEGAVVYGAVRALDADHIKILGRGILDHSRVKETIHFVPTKEQIRAAAEANEAVRNESRTPPILLGYCTNIEIDGITIRDSLMYNVRPIYCNDISIKNVKIIGCWRYNSDGIDMHNCENVHIADCFIRTYDDCICAKGLTVHDPHGNANTETDRHLAFRHLLVERCVTWNDWGKGLEIGAETRAEEMCDIVFRDCDVIHLCGPAMDCMNVDYADVHDVLFENITVEADEIIPVPRGQKYEDDVYDDSYKDYMPSVFTSSVEFHHEYSEGGQRRGINRNFTLRGIRVIGDKPLIFVFRGNDADHLTHHIAIENLSHNGVAITEPSAVAVRKNEFTADLTLDGQPL
ncbi:MAG: hypothetical protein J6R04_01455 [Clostridia bacterium]|nr:hypothetical protein [Clostridia bacterium]